MTHALPASQLVRKHWTAGDDANLRKFHAEGWSDKDIGYILKKPRSTVRQRRAILGLKANGKAGGIKGTRHSQATLAKMAETKRQRWASGGYDHLRPMLPVLLERGRKIRAARRFRQPTDPEARRLYAKIRDTLGVQAAREEFST